MSLLSADVITLSIIQYHAFFTSHYAGHISGITANSTKLLFYNGCITFPLGVDTSMHPFPVGKAFQWLAFPPPLRYQWCGEKSLWAQSAFLGDIVSASSTSAGSRTHICWVTEPRLCGAHFLPRGCTQPCSPSSVDATSPVDLGLAPRDWLWSCSEGFGRPSLSAKGGQGHSGGSGSAPTSGYLAGRVWAGS